MPAIRATIVRELFPDECEAIGDENLDSILGNRYKPVRTEHGENMPVAELVGIVVAAVGFIDASLSLYDRAKAKSELAADDTDAFVALARIELKIPIEVDDSVIESILRRVARQ